MLLPIDKLIPRSVFILLLLVCQVTAECSGTPTVSASSCPYYNKFCCPWKTTPGEPGYCSPSQNYGELCLATGCADIPGCNCGIDIGSCFDSLAGSIPAVTHLCKGSPNRCSDYSTQAGCEFAGCDWSPPPPTPPPIPTPAPTPRPNPPPTPPPTQAPVTQPPTIAPCTLCYRGADPVDPNLIVDFEANTSCGDLDLGSLTLEDDICSTVQEQAYLLCGCPESPPLRPEPKCSLCADGSFPSNPDVVLDVVLGYGSNFYRAPTCSSIAITLSWFGPSEDTSPYQTCEEFQMALDDICGCNTPTDITPNPATPTAAEVVTTVAPPTSSTATNSTQATVVPTATPVMPTVTTAPPTEVATTADPPPPTQTETTVTPPTGGTSLPETGATDPTDLPPVPTSGTKSFVFSKILTSTTIFIYVYYSF